MVIDYNSKLIADLHEAKTEREIVQILKEMGDVGDPIFAHTIWAVYKKHRLSPISHYFISVLDGIDSEEIVGFLKKIVLDSTSSDTDVRWAINALGKKDYYDFAVIKVALEQLAKATKQHVREGLGDFTPEIDEIITYLSNAKAIDKCGSILQTIFEINELPQETRRYALNHLIKINPKQQIQYFINNFETMKGRKIEIILAKEIAGWSGPLSEKLKKLIINTGSSRAKEIIELEYKKKEKENEKEKQKEEIIYGNAKIIKEISTIKRKINSSAKDNLGIEFDLFPGTELLIDQIEIARDEKSLRDACMNLRSSIETIAREASGHAVSEERALKLIPGTRSEHLNKSLNRLFLYLYDKDIKVPNNLYGVKTVYGAASLFTHPEKEDQLKKILVEMNMIELYKNEDWSVVHERLLRLYKEGLEKLYKAIAKEGRKEEK